MAARVRADSQQASYSMQISKSAMGTLARRAKDKIHQPLPRELVWPPDELIYTYLPQLRIAEQQLEEALKNYTTEIVSEHFIKLTKYEMKVFLQDAVIKMEMDDFNKHPFYTHKIFKDPLFLKFSNDLNVAMEEERKRPQSLIEQLTPALSAQLGHLQSDSIVAKSALAELSSKLDTVSVEVAELKQDLGGHMLNLRTEFQSHGLRMEGLLRPLSQALAEGPEVNMCDVMCCMC
ncbi:hypothetical protein HK101_007133 [Irineochytrium annulatum]|nr:hypothetical protein HK101_007133 [Irineochytrium annulatum]